MFDLNFINIFVHESKESKIGSRIQGSTLLRPL